MFYKFNLRQYLSYFNFGSIRINDVIEILIFIGIFFYLIRHFQHTRVWILLKGIFTLFIVYVLSNLFSLKVITNAFQSVISFFIIALIMMFQPELRKMLESVGTKSFSSNIHSMFKKKENKRFSEQTIQEIVSAVDQMSKVKTGALILIENEIPLDEYIKTGIGLDANVTSQLITNVFEKNTALHDGAMVIKGDKIVAATCYLPLSENKKINKSLGTRHRAAIGASEQTDSFVIVVSEETGAISYAHNGKLSHKISSSELASQLQSINYVVKTTSNKFPKRSFIKNTIMAILFGALFWGVLTFAYNPVETVVFENIPVKVVNDVVISDLNKVYEISNGEKVTIEVTGTKETLNSLRESDFSAYADFSKLSITNAVPIQVITNKNVSVDTNNAVMQITVEDASEIDLSIEIQKIGSETNGYFVHNLSTDTPTIKVKGPKSIIKTIDKAVAVVNVNGVHTDFSTTASVMVFDKNGNIVKDDACEISAQTISVTASVYNTKEVPIAVDITSNDEDSHLVVSSTVISEQSIIVAATDENLKDIDVIVIPVDVTNTTSNIVNSIIDIRNFLPAGVQCVEDSNLEYTIQIAKYITREFALYPNNVIIKNGTGRVLGEKTNVKITFDKNSVDNLNILEFGPFVDVEGLKDGRHSVKLQFEEAEDITIEGTYNVDVMVDNGEDQ